MTAAMEGPAEYFGVEAVVNSQRAFQQCGDLHGHALHLN